MDSRNLIFLNLFLFFDAEASQTATEPLGVGRIQLNIVLFFRFICLSKEEPLSYTRRYSNSASDACENS